MDVHPTKNVSIGIDPYPYPHYVPTISHHIPQRNREIFFPNHRGGELAVEFPMYTIQAVPAAARGG